MGYMRGLFMVLAIAGIVSTQAKADCTKAKPGLAKHADALAVKLELLDEALHKVKAEEKTLKIVHHFEDGLLEFIDQLKKGATCTNLVEEFQHFHEDIQLIYADLKANPGIFYQDNVLCAWNTLLPEFVRFQNHLYWY